MLQTCICQEFITSSLWHKIHTASVSSYCPIHHLICPSYTVLPDYEMGNLESCLEIAPQMNVLNQESQKNLDSFWIKTRTDNQGVSMAEAELPKIQIVFPWWILHQETLRRNPMEHQKRFQWESRGSQTVENTSLLIGQISNSWLVESCSIGRH